jgi:hypothetical protein
VRYVIVAAICVGGLVALDTAHAQLAAFPGAEGAGMFALGGRGGDVYHVTNLNDSGEGSLRFGVDNASGPRTIVFDTGGTIELGSRIRIDSPNITIAGQTAPGGGITLKGYHLEIVDTSDVIVRYLRVRPGDIHTAPNVYEPDTLSIRGSNDVVVDHVSASWSTDENLSPTHNSDNVTVQWSMIAEALHNSNHSKGNHGYGSLINGGDYSFHHNLYVHNRSRNPRPQQGGSNPTRLDFVNNVIYNPGDKYGYGAAAEEVFLNFVGNYGISGPNTAETDLYSAGSLQPGQVAATHIYQSGNYMDLNKNGILDGQSNGLADFDGTYILEGSRYNLPIVTTQSAPDALVDVLEGVGASLVRDAVDTRIIGDVQSYGLLGDHIDSQTEVGAWPTLDSGSPLTDTDQDGMPDEYENMIAYLNPNNAADRNLDGNSNGYTALEDYLNFLVGFPAPGDLFGDYNDDGVVDAADYAVWRDAQEAGASSLMNRGPGNSGLVDEDDYATWRANFGMTSGGESTAAGAANLPVPEPASIVLVVLGVFCLTRFRRPR